MAYMQACTLYACDPLIVIVLMVKNEESVIEATLKPFVDIGLTSFLIFDTGSTDRTVSVANAYFEAHALKNGFIEQESFIDFATSRNRALELAKKKFPHAGFLLMPDAEWYMHHTQDLIAFCKEELKNTEPVYLIRIGHANFEFYTSRLIRCKSKIQFVGAVHEVPNYIAHKKVPEQIHFELHQSSAGKEKSATRWQRDLGILLKAHFKEPTDSRTLFYLAQTYECLGDTENAYIFYKKRAEVNGWAEENFITRLRLGNLEKDHALKIAYYLEAFSLRPQRAEPLIKLSQYFLEKNEMQLAFIFAVRAVQIPYPEEDILFVEKYMYDFTRYDILGRCAWYVGEYEIGEWAVREALAVQPEATYLQRNLTYYTDSRV